MKKYIKYILGAAVLPLFMSSCTGNFEDYNTNPDAPTTLPAEAITKKLFDVLASPEENPCQRNNTFWACFGGYVTTPNDWGKGDQLFQYYNCTIDDWVNWSHNYYYGFYSNIFKIESLTGKQGPVYNLAQILKVFAMQIIVNTEGPMAYSKMKPGALTVEYDDERTAYMAMFADLDAAILGLDGIGKLPSMVGIDPVYDGDMDKWVKFGNALKLRMAIRISSVEPEFAHTKALEAVKNTMDSDNDTAWDHLLSYNNGFHTIQGWGEVRPNATITSYMSGYEDPRCPVYFTKAIKGGSEFGYVGVRSGILGISAGTSEYVNGAQVRASKMNVTNKTPMLIFSAAEVAFLKAEAALLGWSDVAPMGAEAYYKEGIRLSFAERGVSGAEEYSESMNKPADFEDLLDAKYNYNIKSKPTVKWANDGKELERVIIQKWIANYPLGGEAWNDYRRTGFPDIFPAAHNASTQGVTSARGQRRIRFSYEEYRTNRQNVMKAVKMLDGGDKDNVDLWWAKKN